MCVYFLLVMVELIVYDSSQIPKYLDRDEMTPTMADIIRFQKAVQSIRKSLPDYLLIRTAFDSNRDNFGGIEQFLSRILANGHDRTDPNDWGVLSEVRRDMLIEQGYAGNDIIWARPVLRDYQPGPYDMSTVERHNIACLMFGGRNYDELFENVYGQKDTDRKKEGLLAVVFFERFSPLQNIRDDLKLTLGNELDANLIGQVQQAGYFR